MKASKDGERLLIQSDNAAVKFEEVEWFITYSTGKQKKLKSDGTEEDIDSLFISDAKCYNTNEVRVL